MIAALSVAILGGLALTSWFFYVLSVHASAGNSDGATVVLEGQSFAAGHLTLKGWALSLDSFWLLDVLFYAAFVAIDGLRGAYLNLVPAVIAALVLLVALRLATLGRRREGTAAAALSVIAIIGLPTTFFASQLLQGPLHVATALWCLVAFLLLRHGRVDWRFWLAAVLFATAMVSDLQALFFGVVPLAMAGAAQMIRRRSAAAGVVPVAAAVVSGVIALVIRAIGDLIGTFYINSPQEAVTHSQLFSNVGLALSYGTKLLGVGLPGLVSPATPQHLEDAHYVAVLVIAVVVLYTIGRLLMGLVGGPAVLGPQMEEPALPGTQRYPALGAEFLDDVLLLAGMADVAIFIDLTQSAAYPYARYLTAAVIFAAILTGRILGRFVDGLAPGWWRRGLAVLGVALIAAFAAGISDGINSPPPVQPAAALATFLEQHHLKIGLGDYWSSSIVTLESHGKVVVRPVVTNLQGQLLAYPRNSQPSWFNNVGFQFFVFQPPNPFGGANQNAAELTFGKPAHIYTADGYIVLVWAAPHHLPPGQA